MVKLSLIEAKVVGTCGNREIWVLGHVLGHIAVINCEFANNK